jgi:hypothetical protein
VADPLSPANIALLHEAAAAQRELRALNGGGRQDLKTIQECGELTEATGRLSRALAQRLGHYRDGGERGAVDAESADVLQLLLGVPNDSDMWGRLQKATQHVRGLIEEARKR